MLGSGEIHGFQKNLTFALELKFYYCNKYCCFSWNDRLIEFEKKSAKYTSLNNHSLSISYSSKWKMAFVKKAASSRSQVQKSFMCTPHLSKKSNKITCIQELRLNKINNFNLFIKEIVSWNWIFFTTQSMRNRMITNTVWCHCLDIY